MGKKARRNSTGSTNATGTVPNVGPQINGNIQPKCFADTTFDDQAARSSSSGSLTGTNSRTRRTGVMGDADGNGHVDGNDFLLKGSNQRQQSADGPYGRGTRQNGILIGLLIP